MTTKTDQPNPLAEYAGEGLENVGAADIVIGRLSILQTLSPELNKDDAAYREGAVAGTIINKANKHLFESVQFLPIAFRREWQEWAPRKSQQGLVRIHNDDQCLLGTEKNDRGVPTNSEGNEIVEAIRWYGLNLSASTAEQCFIVMTSTQLKHARQWITYAFTAKDTDKNGNRFTPPLWGRTYMLSVQKESNAQGSWYGWRVEASDSLVAYCDANKMDCMKEIENIRAVTEQSAIVMAQSQRTHLLTEGSGGDNSPNPDDEDDDIPVL